MLIQVTTKDVEKHIIAHLEAQQGKQGNRNMLRCAFSDLGVPAPTSNYLIPLVRGTLADFEANLLYPDNGDLLIQWSGRAGSTIAFLQGLIAKYCKEKECETLPDNFFHHYDFNAHDEELRLEYQTQLEALEKKRMGIINAVAQAAEESTWAKTILKTKIAFSDMQQRRLEAAMQARTGRSDVSILIVEDQVFSSKLLFTMLNDKFPCQIAKDGYEAIDKYAEMAPDVVLLDVELPDANGHNLAKLFKQHDPRSFVVMVTANNYAEDVRAARENKVQGFIAKPYNKQKILGYIAQYMKAYNKG